MAFHFALHCAEELIHLKFGGYNTLKIINSQKIKKKSDTKELAKCFCCGPPKTKVIVAG